MPDRHPAAERLGASGLEPLVDELIRRFERDGEPVTVTVPALPEEGRRRLADLLGLDRHLATGRRLPIERLATALRVDGARGVRDVVVAVRGPLIDRRSLRAAAAAAREALWRDIETAVAGLALFEGAPARAATWLERVRELGIPGGDVDAHRHRLDAVLACLRRLPRTEPISLAGLAVDVTGSAHGLDPGRRVARLVLEALAAAEAVPAPSDAEGTRAMWERMGVVPDPLSSTVLVLGLRPVGDHALATFLRSGAAVAEPAVLTLRQLQHRGLTVDAPIAYVVENPSLLAEAAGSWSGPPLVCSSGRPSLAVVVLVRQLVASGTVVRQHADFDPAGVDITRWLQDRAGTVPWRMRAADYERALAGGATTSMVGPVGPTPWDPALAERMAAAGRAVHEEAIRAELLAAMAQGFRTTS